MTGGHAFDLIATMRFDPIEGLVDLEGHLAGLTSSAAKLGFAIDRHAVRNELHAATFRLIRTSRLRLRLSRTGAVAIETTVAPPMPAEPVTVALAALPIDPSDFRLCHNTSDRAFYDAARAAAGTFEVIFVAPDGTLTESSFTSVFARRDDGRLVTPRSSAGLVAGALRARLLASGEAVEGVLLPSDLAAGFLVGSALHGLIAARLA